MPGLSPFTSFAHNASRAADSLSARSMSFVPANAFANELVIMLSPTPTSQLSDELKELLEDRSRWKCLVAALKSLTSSEYAGSSAYDQLQRALPPLIKALEGGVRSDHVRRFLFIPLSEDFFPALASLVQFDAQVAAVSLAERSLGEMVAPLGRIVKALVEGSIEGDFERALHVIDVLFATTQSLPPLGRDDTRSSLLQTKALISRLAKCRSDAHRNEERSPPGLVRIVKARDPVGRTPTVMAYVVEPLTRVASGHSRVDDVLPTPPQLFSTLVQDVDGSLHLNGDPSCTTTERMYMDALFRIMQYEQLRQPAEVLATIFGPQGGQSREAIMAAPSGTAARVKFGKELRDTCAVTVFHDVVLSSFGARLGWEALSLMATMHCGPRRCAGSKTAESAVRVEKMVEQGTLVVLTNPFDCKERCGEVLFAKALSGLVPNAVTVSTEVENDQLAPLQQFSVELEALDDDLFSYGRAGAAYCMLLLPLDFVFNVGHRILHMLARSSAPPMPRLLVDSLLPQRRPTVREFMQQPIAPSINASFLVNLSERTVAASLSSLRTSSQEETISALRDAKRQSGSFLLDHSQLEAFGAAMTSRVTLIQGPPGCGKTFIGVQIVRALLASSRRDRVLLVCFTNHALDQFIRHCIDSGIPLESVCRLGSKFKWEALERRSLNRIKEQWPPRANHAFKELRSEIRERVDFARTEFRATLPEDANDMEVLLHLNRIESPLTAGIFQSIKDDEGFEEVSNSSKKEILAQWLNGDKRLGVALETLTAHSICRTSDFSAVWKIPKVERLKLLSKMRAVHLRKMSTTRRCVDDLADSIARLRGRESRESLINANVRILCATSSYCALNPDLIEEFAAETVVVEEAGELREVDTLLALRDATKRVVLIGDHLQLRPKISRHELTATFGKIHCRVNADVSLFERLIAAGMPHVTLSVQRRMRPEIADLIRRADCMALYPSLVDHTVAVTRGPPLGFSPQASVWWLAHTFPEDKPDFMKSRTNSREAAVVVNVASYVAPQHRDGGTIAVLTPYLGQLRELRKQLEKVRITTRLEDADLEGLRIGGDRGLDSRGDSKALKDCVALATVDNYQGEEADVVIVSLVRSNHDGSIGFLGDVNRVNVMLSRAKQQLIIVANVGTIRVCQNQSAAPFRRVVDYLDGKGCVQRHIPLVCKNHGAAATVTVDKSDQLRTRYSDGGCEQPCGAVKPCGHVCKRRCHPDDGSHKIGAATCQEVCQRTPSCGRHACLRRCGDECDPCSAFVVEKIARCGHEVRVKCIDFEEDKRLDVVVCKCRLKQAEKSLCGHEVAMECGVVKRLDEGEALSKLIVHKDGLFCCAAPCGKTFSCGHTCNATCGNCHERFADILTSRVCETDREHSNFNKFSTGQSEARPRPSADTLPLSSVTNFRSAAVLSAHAGNCLRRCGRPLPCGHDCVKTCHLPNPCPSSCMQRCRTTCIHLPKGCGRSCIDPCNLCFEPCAWACSAHSDGSPLQACSHPCCLPCDRKLCNRRCDVVLKCGHQCASLCGEKCEGVPCVVCNPLQRLISAVEFEITVAQVDLASDRILATPCGHLALMSELDVMFHLETAYDKNLMPATIGAMKERLGEGFVVPTCFQCRRTLESVDGLLCRYTRVCKIIRFDANEQNFAQVVSAKIDDAAAALTQLRLRVDERAVRDVFEKVQKLKSEIATRSPFARLTAAMATASRNASLRFEAVPALSLSAQVFELELCANAIAISAEKCGKSTAAGIKRKLNNILLISQLGVAEASASGATTTCARIAAAAAVAVEAVMLELCAANQADEPFRTTKSFLAAKLAEPISLTLAALCPKFGALAATAAALAPNVAPMTLKEVLKVMPEMARRGAYGSHVKRCPNGHFYFVGDCGGAMERGVCADCGAVVGGERHVNAPGNDDVDEV